MEVTKMRKTTKLRNLLKKGKAVWASGAYDALSARLIEEAGFDAILSTGFGISASHLGQPDAEIYTMTENLNVVRLMVDVVDIPIIADTDTGYGNAINIMRTVREFERAGVAAVIFEDQIAPKRCPACVETINVIPIDEAAGKIRAAVEAKTDPDLIIIARTDATNVDEGIIRAKAYVEAGADMVQPISKGVKNLDELLKFKKGVKAPISLQILAWLESDLSPNDIEEIASIATFPLVPLMTTTQALRANLGELIKTKTTSGLPFPRIALKDFNEFIGMPKIEDLQLKYMPSSS
jgi:2-methylisocitrate lyase-like PEP mutase family enzyme